MTRRTNWSRVRILFVAANPTATARLRIDDEYRQIQQKLRGSRLGSSLELIPCVAAQPNDLRRASS